MPIPRNEQRLISALGMLLFLLSCNYVPWQQRYYQSVFVRNMDGEPGVLVEYHLVAPAETRYGWIFNRPVFKSAFASSGVPDTGIKMSAELNMQFLLIEWLGIGLFTGGLNLLLRHAIDG